MNSESRIAQLGDPVLRQQALPVDSYSGPEFRQLIATMHSVMLAADGVGLAAPQLGVSKQILIIASRPTQRYPKAPEIRPLVMTNPRFDILDATTIKDWEGCLSIPGIRALAPRYSAIHVYYQDVVGNAEEIRLEGFPARVFQHEFDHLQGCVYLDRVENNRDIVTESEFFKRIAA
jgi:peptide deformylase